MVVMTFFLIMIWVFGSASHWVCESLGLWVIEYSSLWVVEFLSLWVFGPLSNISEVNNDLISISKMLMIMVMMTNHWPFKVGCDQNQMIFKLRSAVKSHLTKCDFVQSGVYRKMPHHVKSIPWQVEYVINLKMKPFKWCDLYIFWTLCCMTSLRFWVVQAIKGRDKNTSQMGLRGGQLPLVEGTWRYSQELVMTFCQKAWNVS